MILRRLPLLSAIAGVALVSARGASAQEDAFSLDGLVVTAAPVPIAAEMVASHFTILDRAELGRHADRTLGEVLRDVAGMDVVRSGSYGAATSVFLRGGESDYTLVLVDGVQVNQPGGAFDFSSLTTDNVERVEIVRGPASALYGSDAVTGVVQVITRTGRGAPSGAIAFEAGSYGRRDWSADLAAGTGSAGYSVAVSRRSGDGILSINNQHVATTLSGRARLLPDDETEVALSLRWTEHEFHFPTDGSGAIVDENQYTFGDQATVQATVRRGVGDRLTLLALVGLNETDGGTDDRPDGVADTLGFYGYSSLDRFRRASGELRAVVEMDAATVTVGAEAERERQRSFNESLADFGTTTGRSDNERTNRAGFVHLFVDASPFAVTGGARLEDNERFGRLVTWQAGITWPLPVESGPRLRATAGTGIKEPTFFENFATGFATGNPDLDPERSRSWEIGADQPLLDGRLTLNASYFDQRFEDLIQYTFSRPDPRGPSYFNVAAARARGVEVGVDATLGRFALGAAHSRLDTEVTDAGFDEGPGATFVEGEPLLRRPTSSWSFRASGAVAGLRAFARLRLVGERSDRDFSTFPASPVTLAGYEALSVGAEWTAPALGGGLPGFGLTVRGENLLDERYQEVLGFPAPGRSISVGLRLALGGGGT